MTTEILEIQEIAESQASKFVTHNEGLRRIEGMLVRVLSRTNGGPPGTPANGNTYIVDSATGDWSTASVGDIAHYYGGAWHFYSPIEGLRVWVNDTDTLVVWDGAAWSLFFSAPKFATSGKTANFSVAVGDRGIVFLVDASAGAVTASLPASATAGNGFAVGVKKIDSSSNAVTISADGTDTIEGSASLSLNAQWAGTLLSTNGAGTWVQIGGGSGGGANLPLLDNQDLFADSADQTKILRFELANILAGTTRTATWQDKDGTVAMLSDITGGGNASAEFEEDAGTTTGLTWGYQAGSLRVDGTITDFAANTVSLTDEATNYVEIDPVALGVVVNQTGFTAGNIPIREVATSAGSISSSTDRRAWVVARQVFYSGLTADLPAQDQKVSRPEIQDYGETTSFPASSAGAVTIDLEAGNVAELELTEDTTISFANPPASGITGSLTLILSQDATGGWTVTWPAIVAWAGGTAPTLSTAAGAVDVLTFVTTDGGTTWYGFPAGLDMQ